jgi:hypothetical protein
MTAPQRSIRYRKLLRGERRFEMGEQAWLVVFAAMPVLGTVLGAVTYWIRERARWTAVTSVLKQGPHGTQVRFKAVDGQGRATTEWEITLPPAAGSDDELSH